MNIGKNRAVDRGNSVRHADGYRLIKSPVRSLGPEDVAFRQHAWRKLPEITEGHDESGSIEVSSQGTERSPSSSRAGSLDRGRKSAL
jgi:hypothetical protein